MAKGRQGAATPKTPMGDAPKAHHTILSLEVTGGFLKGAKFEFADGLNCIIGGRGTGKTTVLEFVRYVLALMPNEKTMPARSRAIKALVQSNLVSQDGSVSACAPSTAWATWGSGRGTTARRC